MAGEAALSALGAAWQALAMLAVAPTALGGAVIRSAAGPVRNRWLADLRAALPRSAPWRTVPLHADDDRLLGGIDLVATLIAGRRVASSGLLAQSDGGVLVVAMAERAAASTLAHVAVALDRGEAVCARDGIEAAQPARFAALALDEGGDDDERPADALRERLAFEVDLRSVSWRELDTLAPFEPATLDRARAAWRDVQAGDDIVEALCAASAALGVASLRAPLFALAVARIAAALDGRAVADADDAALAARLVFSSRATRLPAAAAAEDDGPRDEADDAPPHDEDAAAGADGDPPPQQPAPDPVDDAEPSTIDPKEVDLDALVLAAAAAAIPSGLLARLVAAGAAASRGAGAGRAGALRKSLSRGRPAGVRRGDPRGGARLDLVATLRAAVPWQRLRQRHLANALGRHDTTHGSAPDTAREAPPSRDPRPRLVIRRDDFRVGRFQQRTRTTTIFAVDASGSAALHRLAEAKGAVELLLAECYVRRDSVAVLAFRRSGAELLLPPTRSLVRAKRALAELPGGGGTPLAAGIAAARELALAVRRRGDTPVVVVLSDGRANIAADGSPGRPRAEADATLAAHALRADGLAALFIDTSPQPSSVARAIAGAMQARYLPLPHADAGTVSRAVAQVNDGRPARLGA